MKILTTALAVALAAVSFAPSTAMARSHGWNNGHHHGSKWNNHHRQRHCWYKWRHHHRVRVCR